MHRTLHWTEPVTTQFTAEETRSFLWFDGATYDASRNFLPVYSENISLSSGSASANGVIKNPVYQPLDDNSIIALGNAAEYLQSEPEIKVNVITSRKQDLAAVSIVPLRKNSLTGRIEKLVSFDLEVYPTGNAARRSIPVFASGSVLASGSWFKIGVVNNGIHKLDYSFFSSMGIDMSTIDPRNIRIYGNGHGQLPYSNSGVHQDDLNEYAIMVQGESDGVFDSTDYVLFYGVSPNTWTYDSTAGHNHYHHYVHNYSDTTYYFINTDLGPGKRVALQSSSLLAPTNNVTSFDDYAFHELDNVNMIKSGREWYGEEFDILTSYNFGFNFPNIDVTSNACVEVDLISRDDNGSSQYSVTAQSGSSVITVSPTTPGCYYCPYANDGSTEMCFTPNNSAINVNISKLTSGALGYLNWVRVNARRHLTMNTGMMSFRDSKSAGTGNVAQYFLDGYTSSLTVWDVTDLANVAQQITTINSTFLQWTLPADSVREFVAFDGSEFYTPVYFGKVANQNLHGMQPVDLIIVSNAAFLTQAGELAQLHAQYDDLSYVIVTPQQIYNEFSSGSQDVTAIRDFVRMLYYRAQTKEEMPRYLLLFGDGSYDNKHRMASNTNYLPTFQNLNSVGPTESYVSDEYYGLLDDAGGWDGSSDIGYVDIGIGRFPVQTSQQAEDMVQKIKHYMTRQIPSTNISACTNDQCSKGGEWRTWLTFIGDDEDSDIHMSQSDQLATLVDTTYDIYNIDKIYLDAYQQQQTPGGERYPDVSAAINHRMDKGCLIMNYTGHGGEVGLAHERILDVPMINAWTNICNMPLWVTATCEFSRFDDPGRTSAGEFVFLNPNGGGIGLFTTVRLVYSTPNFNLNKKFYECAFVPIDGEMPRVGDLYRITKVTSGNNTNNRNFTLLGDPALRLNYPINNVVTTEVNNVAVTSSSSDTIRALSMVTVKGHITDSIGNLMTDFNGIIYPTVFDKAKAITTLGNDPPNAPFTFMLQKNILYHGKVSVTNGNFQFSFVVPKDIAYQYGVGRISYYAEDGVTDAAGAYEQIIVGGSNTNAPADLTGPSVKLFLNDSNFVSGGLTNDSPHLFAIVRDSNGVNTVGNGIGHDVVAILDAQSENAIVLNDYYQADMNSYQSGRIIYPFTDLSEGTHTLSLKVWDVYNNSTTVTTEFVVTKSTGLQLSHVLNYPNPFTTNTSFYLEYNQCCTQYNVMIQVFTVSGKLVKTINQEVNSDGYRSDPIEWDGRDDYGDKIGRGVYIYRVFAQTSDGLSAEKYEKLVILN
ncbi:MAG: type IX secretion system sortase PorU [Bacteroidetes bacterium]|nr:type IX secretion system sortase PorU [Bacteroidota bacterium]